MTAAPGPGPVAGPGPDRGGALADLAGHLGDGPATAVDDHELAVLLEADGLTDEQARERYGGRDVFAVARELRRRAGVGPPAPSPAPVDWYATSGVAVLRGATFTLAGLLTMTAAAVGGGTRAATAVLLCNAVGIAALQVVAFLAYLSMERSGGEAAAAVHPLLVVLVGPVAVGTVLAFAVDVRTGLLAGTALSLLVGIVLLLVVGRVALVAVVVVPVGALGLLVAADSPLAPPPGVVVGAWVLAAALLVLAAHLVTRPHGARVRPQLGAVDLRAALPVGVAGLSVGGVVLAAAVVLGRSPTLDGADSRRWLVASLPFLVPVSFAELVVVRLRSHLLRTTARTADIDGFRRAARVATAWSAASVVAFVAVATAASWWLLPPAPDRLALPAAFGLLAVLLTAGLLLLAGDRPLAEAGLLAVAGAAVVAASAGVPSSGAAGRVVVLLAAAAAVGLLLGAVATARPASYR